MPKKVSSRPKKVPTHDALVKRACNWLDKTCRCTLVVAHGSLQVNEMPDAIGWTSGLSTILIEVKTTRADFLKDRDKSFRKIPELGMGELRYYFVVKGVATPKDMPDGWGLVEIDGQSLRRTKHATPFRKRNTAAETRLMYAVASQQQRALTDLHRMWRKSGRA